MNNESQVIDDDSVKDDEKSTNFVPSGNQIKWLNAALKPETGNRITAISIEAHVSRDAYYRWLKNPKFVKWFDEQFDEGLSHMRWWFNKLGMKKSDRDFRYFELMMTKHFGYVKKSEVKNENTEIKKLDEESIEEIDKYFQNKKVKDAENVT